MVYAAIARRRTTSTWRAINTYVRGGLVRVRRVCRYSFQTSFSFGPLFRLFVVFSNRGQRVTMMTHKGERSVAHFPNVSQNQNGTPYVFRGHFFFVRSARRRVNARAIFLAVTFGYVKKITITFVIIYYRPRGRPYNMCVCVCTRVLRSSLSRITDKKLLFIIVYRIALYYVTGIFFLYRFSSNLYI